ncbi:hypothetical protein [Actinocrispum wychmicini]|uniref:Uncharacterized protein n=1 Tax=Actinocrispum wychmicini TaxID=1213861 RepID=A0A4R2JZU7_9PSEU|nr:hypothetical protein [Actinocrispum wychmicini]TCO64897.1 hypothetical protein EV192_101681 [Actinocrispum wychmicini]
MSEQELRDGLRLAVADEPPMTFNLDDLVSTAERLTRRRRALVAVGAGTALVAAAAVAVPVLLGIAPGGPAELPMAASSTPSAVPKSPSVDYLTRRGQEMQAYLQTQFPRVVPGVTQVVAEPFGGEATGQVDAGQQYLNTFVKFVVSDAPTAVNVQVQTTSAADQDCAGCQSVQQVDGSKVLLQVEDEQDGTKILTAIHKRVDGSVTKVATYNYDPTGTSAPKFKDGMLTVDQLLRLATDPQLHM